MHAGGLRDAGLSLPHFDIRLRHHNPLSSPTVTKSTCRYRAVVKSTQQAGHQASVTATNWQLSQGNSPLEVSCLPNKPTK